MIFSVWLWWRGYLTLRLEGASIERLLNELAEAEIPVWNVRRLTLDVLIINTPVSTYSQIRLFLWEKQIKVSILDRHGFPFLFSKLKGRMFWGIGLICALLITIYLSGFIWFIEVVGNEEIAMVQFGSLLEEYGVKVGMRRSNLNLRQLETALLTRFPELVWAEIDLRGVKVVLNVAEREIRPGEEQRIGDIYSNQAGVITEVLVLRGSPLVEEGNTVREGEQLISGQYYDQRGRRQVGAARGIVLAKVWYSAVGEAPFIHWEPRLTGVTKLQFTLTLGTLKIPIGRSRDLHRHLVTKQTWCLSLGQALLPLEWAKIQYSEVEYTAITLPLEEARQLALEQARASLSKRGVDLEKIRKQRIEEFEMQDGEGIHLTLWVEVEEDIGQFIPQ